MRALDASRAIRRVGRRIAELRLARGWTQEKFAERASVSVKYVQRIEANMEKIRQWETVSKR